MPTLSLSAAVDFGKYGGKEGEKLYSPLVEQAEADYVLAFELMEALRALPYLKKDGLMITNTQKILPMPVITGAAKYPEDAEQVVRAHGRTVAYDALALAEQCGTSRAVNTVLLGTLSKHLPFSEEQWLNALKNCVPVKHLQANLAAFELGRAAKED